MPDKYKFDDIDRRILSLLQLDATQSVQEIAAQVGLTNNPCWRRIRRLETDGVIINRVAVVDAAKLGLGITAFVTIRTDKHTKGWLTNFARSVKIIPEIIECHRMTGDVDYLLKIVVSDLTHYDEVYRRLIDMVPDLSDVSSTFSMERLKSGAIIDAATAL